MSLGVWIGWFDGLKKTNSQTQCLDYKGISKFHSTLVEQGRRTLPKDDRVNIVILCESVYMSDDTV